MDECRFHRFDSQQNISVWLCRIDFQTQLLLVAIEPALDWLDDTFQPQVSHWHSAAEVCMDSSDLVEYMSKEVLSSGT